MANNRLPFGLCEKYGIDLPKNAEPRDAWEALKKKGLVTVDESKNIVIDPRTLLDDEQLPRSVGAKWSNYEITMPDGSVARFAEGSKLQNKEIFAGYGCKRKIDKLDALMSAYPDSKPERWCKVKARAEIVLSDGEIIKAEVHWFEEPTIGKVEVRFKKSL